MRRQLQGVVLSIAGLGLMGSAVLQGFVNVPHLRQDLLEIAVRPTLVAAVMLVLSFSVLAMFAFGAHVLSGAIRSFRGVHPQPAALWIVAATYVVFGLTGFFVVIRSPHMLGYTGMGLLVAVGTAMGQSRPGRRVQGAA